MKAKYTPTHDNYFAYLSDCVGGTFEFKYLSTVNGVMKFEPIDINFRSKNPVPDSDLDFIDGFGEGVYRMVASGWDIHTGKIIEKDIATHDFCIMGDHIFKKLKN